MDSAEEKDEHKQTGTSCIRTGPGDLFRNTGDKDTAYSDGQYKDPYLFSENGRTEKIYKWFVFQNKFENCY